MGRYQADCKMLKEFLALPHRATAVLDKFAALPGAIRETDRAMEGFVYIPATRKNPVLLVAHADTVADESVKIALEEKRGVIRNKCGILGADDRAGCAMLWLLRNTGHGLLVTDGEEYGGIGAEFLCTAFPDLHDEINRDYRFMIEIDRRGKNDFKCYDVGTPEFRAYVSQKTGFSEPDRSSFTDIVYLCRDICGVNLSCGYYEPHTASEHIVKMQWHRTLQLLRRWLAEEDIPKFPLDAPRSDGDKLSGLIALWQQVRPAAKP